MTHSNVIINRKVNFPWVLVILTSFGERKEKKIDFVLSRTLNIFVGDKRQELGMKIDSHQSDQPFQFAHN